MVKTYMPIVYISISLVGRVFPSGSDDLDQGHTSDGPEEKHKAIYKEFVDDRVAEISKESVSVLRSKKYDKFRYVSQHFISRNSGRSELKSRNEGAKGVDNISQKEAACAEATLGGIYERIERLEPEHAVGTESTLLRKVEQDKTDDSARLSRRPGKNAVDGSEGNDGKASEMRDLNKTKRKRSRKNKSRRRSK